MLVLNPERSPSEQDHFFTYHFSPLVCEAVQEAAWDLPANAPLDEEAVKEYMLDAIADDDAPFTGDVQIEDIEKYAGFITLATAAYNSPQGTNAAPAPAAPPAPVAETAEELRRRAKGLTKKLKASRTCRRASTPASIPTRSRSRSSRAGASWRTSSRR